MALTDFRYSARALIKNPARLIEMGERAHQEARPDAARHVARICFEVAGVENATA